MTSFIIMEVGGVTNKNIILFRQMTMYVVEKQILAWNA